MVEDKRACRSLWVGELACSSRAYHIPFEFYFYFKLIFIKNVAYLNIVKGKIF